MVIWLTRYSWRNGGQSVVYINVSFDEWVYRKLSIGLAILQTHNWNSRHLTRYVTAKKKRKRKKIVFNHWVHGYPSCRQALDMRSLILVVEANCISNLSPNLTDYPKSICEGVTTITLQNYDAKLVTLLQMFSDYRLAISARSWLNHERCIYYLVAKKDIQPGFEPGSSECWSDALTNWATGTLELEQKIDP